MRNFIFQQRSHLNIFFKGQFLELFQKLVAFLCAVCCFPCSTVLASKRGTFFPSLIGIPTPQKNMHPEIMLPAWYENHISFFLCRAKRQQHKGAGLIECKGLQQTSLGAPSLAFPSFISSSTPFVYHF
jgi:hypothetical protein